MRDFEYSDDFVNPLDDFENFLINEGWPYHRLDGDDIVIETGDELCRYLIRCGYDARDRILRVYCYLGLRVKKNSTTKILHLINRINDRLDAGAFVLRKGDSDEVFASGDAVRKGGRDEIVFRMNSSLFYEPGEGESLFESMTEACLDLVEGYVPAIIAVMDCGGDVDQVLSMVRPGRIAQA